MTNKPDKAPEVYICEECGNILKAQELSRNREQGWNVCKMRKYRTEHYCEAYIHTYVRKDDSNG